VFSQQRDNIITHSWIMCRNLSLRHNMIRNHRVISWVRLRTSCVPSVVAERMQSSISPSRNRFICMLPNCATSLLNSVLCCPCPALCVMHLSVCPSVWPIVFLTLIWSAALTQCDSPGGSTRCTHHTYFSKY